MSYTLNTWAIRETIRIELVNYPTLCDALMRCDFLLEDVKRCVEEDLEQDGRDVEDWNDADIMRHVGHSLELLLDLAVTIIHNEERG